MRMPNGLFKMYQELRTSEPNELIWISFKFDFTGFQMKNHIMYNGNLEFRPLGVIVLDNNFLCQVSEPWIKLTEIELMSYRSDENWQPELLA